NNELLKVRRYSFSHTCLLSLRRFFNAIQTGRNAPSSSFSQNFVFAFPMARSQPDLPVTKCLRHLSCNNLSPSLSFEPLSILSKPLSKHSQCCLYVRLWKRSVKK